MGNINKKKSITKGIIDSIESFRLTRKEAPEGFNKELTDADAFFLGK